VVDCVLDVVRRDWPVVHPDGTLAELRKKKDIGEKRKKKWKDRYFQKKKGWL
jgi:hypothetical protein